MAPAASLLFQAPVFQAAPEVAPPVAFEEPEPKRRRKSSAPEEESAPAEEAAPKRRRRSKKAADEASAPAEESAPPAEAEESAAETKTRRRRRSKKSDEAQAASEDSAQKVEASPDDSESADEEDSSSRRRRRRRARSSAASEESADPADQVQALKGSTRLEAKKMRRREGRREGRRRHSISESEFLARRESVERTMVIRDQDGLDQIAILEDGLLVEHYVARRTQSSMVGNIYLGRVQNVLPSMEAAFVDVGQVNVANHRGLRAAGDVVLDEQAVFEDRDLIEAVLVSDDPVLVQVTKDPIGHKGARLTSQITLAGRYLVLIPGGSMMGISRKLPDKERARLKKILKAVVPSGSGVIVRTAAEGASEEQIRDDVARLTRQWEDIEKKRTNTKSAPTLLRGEPELAVRVVRDIFNEDFSKLVIEGRDTYATVKEYVDELSPELSDRVEQWVGTEDVFHAHRIDEQLAKGMDRKVWLPSGGTLIIDRTEAMTVIDVNTGKFIGAGGTLEETVTRNNLEAAEEIVRQLRLRDIGGIVIIDFVDMVLESNRDLVLRRLVECLGRDRTRHQVTEITSLGLVQMTRKRVGEGLVEAFSSSCEACEGRGFIVHHHPVETSGADSSSKSTKASKKQLKKAEARRIEENADHERAKEALSAIAAASTRKEDEASAPTEKAPAKKRRARAASAEPEQGAAAAEPTPEAPAQDEPQAQSATEAPAPDVKVSAGTDESATKRPRRRRRVAESAPMPELPIHIDLPEPVDTSDKPAVPLKDASEIQLPEQHDKAPATRRRASRKAATASSAEPAPAPALEAAPARVLLAAAEAPAPQAQAVEAPTAEAPEASEVQAAAESAPRKTRKRRAAASTGIIEPEATPAPIVVDLPARADVSEPAAPTRSTDEIQLPEASEQPRAKRRRRVVSTGIVDAG